MPQAAQQGRPDSGHQQRAANSEVNQDVVQGSFTLQWPWLTRSARKILQNDIPGFQNAIEALPEISDYSPPQVDRIWGIWGSYHNTPKATFYLFKGDYT